jgi:hypothetical protein
MLMRDDCWWSHEAEAARQNFSKLAPALTRFTPTRLGTVAVAIRTEYRDETPYTLGGHPERDFKRPDRRRACQCPDLLVL